MTHQGVKCIGLREIPVIEEGDDLSGIILRALDSQGMDLEDRDIIVIAHTVVSKAEGRVVTRGSVEVSEEALRIAQKSGFDPVHVELALRESRIVLRNSGVLITEGLNGDLANFAGVDKSNAPDDSFVLLPANPDRSAERIRERLAEATGKDVAIIISDTRGRPWRRGTINVGIGSAGINAFRHNRGRKDIYGRTLQRSTVCQIDELAAAAEPIMGQANEGRPVVIIRGYLYEKGEESAKDIVMSPQENLFR